MTQKIAYARSGDRLSARYLNKIVDGANLALDVLGPPRSTRLPTNDSLVPTLDVNGNGVIDGIGTAIYTETERVTSTVRVFNPDDSSVFVDVDRIDQVTLRNDRGEVLTLIFTNV